MLPQPVRLLNLLLHARFGQGIFRGENSAEVILRSSCVRTFCEPICFKLGVMLNSTKLYSLNDFQVHSGWQGYGKTSACAVILCNHSVVELHEAAQVFMMVDYVRDMTVKKSCKYGRNGSFWAFVVLISEFVFAFICVLPWGNCSGWQGVKHLYLTKWPEKMLRMIACFLWYAFSQPGGRGLAQADTEALQCFLISRWKGMCILVRKMRRDVCLFI